MENGIKCAGVGMGGSAGGTSMRPSANPAATVSPLDVNLLDNSGFRLPRRVGLG